MSMNINGMRLHFILILFIMAILDIGQVAASDVLQQQGAGPVSQLNNAATEMPSPSASEAFLERVRVYSRQQAAEAAYNLAILAVSREDLVSTQVLIEEAVQLQPSNPNYHLAAARVAYLTGEYDAAERYQLQTLEIAQSMLEPDAIQIATIMDELSAVYLAQSRYQEAENRLRQGLAIREQALGKMHPSVAANLNDLAGFTMRNRRFDETEKLLIRALHILKASDDTSPAEAAIAMHNLGDFYTNQERSSEADDLYRQALRIWEMAPAEYRLQLAVMLNDLGNHYRSQNRLDEAKPQFDLVIALLTEEIEQDHYHVSAARAGLKAIESAREKDNEVGKYSQRLFEELQTQITEHGSVK